MAVGTVEEGTFVAARTRRGRRDNRFGTGGFALVRDFFAEGMPGAVLDGRGRLILAGRVPVEDVSGEDTSELSLTRLLPSGRVDRSFTRIWLVTRRIEKHATSLGVALQSDGRILVLGEGSYEDCRSCAGAAYELVRFTGGGRLPR